MHASDNTTEGSQVSSVSVVSGLGVSNIRPACSFYVVVMSLISLEYEKWSGQWRGPVTVGLETLFVTTMKEQKCLLLLDGDEQHRSAEQ